MGKQSIVVQRAARVSPPVQYSHVDDVGTSVWVPHPLMSFPVKVSFAHTSRNTGYRDDLELGQQLAFHHINVAEMLPVFIIGGPG